MLPAEHIFQSSSIRNRRTTRQTCRGFRNTYILRDSTIPCARARTHARVPTISLGTSETLEPNHGGLHTCILILTATVLTNMWGSKRGCVSVGVYISPLSVVLCRLYCRFAEQYSRAAAAAAATSAAATPHPSLQHP